MTYATDISPDILAAGRWVQGRWGILRNVRQFRVGLAFPAPLSEQRIES